MVVCVVGFGSPLGHPYQTGVDEVESGEEPFDLGVAAHGSGGGCRLGQFPGGAHSFAVLVVGAVRDGQEAAGHDRVPVAGQDAVRVTFVPDDVQHRHHQQADGTAEVEQREGLRVVQNGVHIAHIVLDRDTVRIVHQQLFTVGNGDRVDVDVDYPGLRVDALGHLVDVAEGGNAGAQVEELVDPGLDHEPDGTVHERAVRLGDQPDLGQQIHDLAAVFTIDGEVVRPTEPVVVTARHIRLADIDGLGSPIWSLHR